MSLRTAKTGLSAAVLLCSGFLLRSALAQTPTPTPTPIPSSGSVTTWSTENDRAVSGVNIQEQEDGTVWFLIPLNDRIVQLQTDGTTFKQWQIRDDKNLGANPVEFWIDGTTIWFIENGESQIDAGFSAIGRLDTVTGALREWVLPGSRPAGLYRSPDGNTIWIPQTNGRMQSLDLNTLAVTDYRSTKTFAYADMVVGPDGALWLVDFGDNRIVRWVPGAAQETSWTIADPNFGRLNSSQLRFDQAGALWITEAAAARVDRFDPATNTLSVYGGFFVPIHFDISGGRLFVSEAAGDNGRVVAFDPAFAAPGVTALTPETLDVNRLPNARSATIRDTTAIVSNFTSTKAVAADTDVKITSGGAGMVRTQFPVTNAYGLTVTGKGIWVGSQSKLVHILPPTLGSASDPVVPSAAQFGVSPGIRIQQEATLVNRGGATVAGDAVFMYSPGAFFPSASYSVDPGDTVVLSDLFGNASSNSGLQIGPVRFRVTSGSAADLSGTLRSAMLRSDGSSFGYSFPLFQPGDFPPAGSSWTIFLGDRATEVSTLDVYSPTGGDAVAALVAPDGTIRGTRRFQLATNGSGSYNPAASAFGADPEPGDVVRLSVLSGAIAAHALVLDTGSSDVEASLPTAAATEGVFPNLSNFAGPGGRLSDLRISNPGGSPVDVTLAFRQDGGAPPRLATVTVPAGGSISITNSLSDFFGVLAGGAVTYAATGPVAVSARVASRRDEGDYGTFFPAIDPSGAIAPAGAAEAIGVPQSDTRQTDLLLYNAGSDGSVTVIGLDASGAETGRETLPIPSQTTLRRPAIANEVGGSGAVRLRVETTLGTRIYAATEQIDLGTGDVELARMR